MNPRHVLYVHNTADIYGASRSLLRLLSRAPSHGILPHVVIPEPGLLRAKLEQLNVEVTVDPWLAVINRSEFRSLKLVNFGLRYPASALRLARLIRTKRIDLVHTNTGVMPTPALAAKIAGVPHVWHVRDSFLEFRSLWKAYRGYITALSHRILAISQSVADQFDGSNKVEVIYNGLPVENYPTDREPSRSEFRNRFGLGTTPVVGCVGRIKYVRKGQEFLVEAMALLKKKGLRAKCLLVGSPAPGNERHLEDLKRLIEKLDLNEEVVFAGELDDVIPAYAAMDVFVLPSQQPEPLGNVVLEAMAMRLPVVATAMGGPLEQLEEGVTGYLVPKGSAAAIADRLERLFKDPELARAMGDKGRARLENHFSLDQTVAKVIAVYDSLIQKSEAKSA